MSRAHSVTLALILLAALLAGALVWLLGLASVLPPEPRETPTQIPMAAADVPESAARGEPLSERTVMPEEPADLPSMPVFSLRGRVVDPAGAPLADVGIGVPIEDGEPPITGRSDAAGSFRLSASALPCYVVIDDARWTTLRMGEVREDAPLVPALVIAAPAVEVRGIVVDGSNRPLAGARIGIRLDPGAEAALPGDPDQGFRGEWNVESAEDGTFAFERAPAVARARLSTRLAGFKADERTLDLPPTSPLRIVLEPEEQDHPVLTGTVVREDGSAIQGATISLGSGRARTDIHGRFRLVCGWFDAATPLVVVPTRTSPVILAGFGAGIDPDARELPPERIVVPERRLSIQGRVLLSNGTPAKHWRITIADPTPLDPGGVSSDIAEAEAVVRTDAQGGFRLDGLVDRSYTLLASGRDRTSRAELLVRSDPLPAGSRDVVLSAPDGNPGATITGRVTTEAGAFVPGARLGLGQPESRTGARYAMQGRFRAVCGPDGRFELAGIPDGLAYLVVTGPAFLPVRVALDPGAPRTDLTVRVRLRRELSFDGSAALPEPELLRAIAGGSAAPIWRSSAGTPRAFDLLRLEGGTSGTILVGDDVRELVLYRGCRELGRVPVAPATEGTTRLAWP